MKRRTTNKTSKPRTSKHKSNSAIDTSEFDKEFVADTFSEIPPRERSRWQRAKRKPGRPRVGRGSKVISVSVERDLLQRSDRLAKKMGVTRANLVARGLRAVLAVEES